MFEIYNIDPTCHTLNEEMNKDLAIWFAVRDLLGLKLTEDRLLRVQQLFDHSHLLSLLGSRTRQYLTMLLRANAKTVYSIFITTLRSD